MSEQQRGRRALEVGPTGQVVAENLARLRKRRELTARQLSAALERAGRPIPASGITRMERGERHVTTDELAALAVVFGVSPQALLLPLTASPDDRVQITGGGEVDALRAWEWGIGRIPLKLSEGPEERRQMEDHRFYGMPLWLQDHVRYQVIGHVKGPIQLTGDAKQMIEADRARYEQETGESIDPAEFRRLWIQAKFGGRDDG